MSRNNATNTANVELARRINREARRDPNSPYAGKFVGIAHGQVVVIAETSREVLRRLKEVEPDPMKCCCIECSADYETVQEVLGVVTWQW